MPKNGYMRVTRGTVETPHGKNGLVIEVIQGRASMRPTQVIETTQGDSGGNADWEEGDQVYRAQVAGHYTSGNAGGTCTYTHATKNLNLTDAFKNVQAGQWIEVTGGTGITAGYYQIDTVTDADNVILVDAPGSGDNADTTIVGFDRIAHYTQGRASISLGKGETWTGSVIVQDSTWTGSWNKGRRATLVLDLLFKDDIVRS